MKSKKQFKRKKEATEAPGMSDKKFGQPATGEDMKNGNYTSATRVYLDENDPS